MNRIAILSRNNRLKERYKEILSPENYLVYYPSTEEINENSGNVIIIDLITFPEFQNKNIKHEFSLKTIPVLVVLNTQLLNVFGYFLGADDFITENVSAKELTMRIKQLLWRLHGINSEDIIQIQDMIIDLAQHKVLISLEPIMLTYMEFKLLQFLVSNKNRVFSRNHILERVWGYDYYGGARTVDVHIRRLRFKLGPKHGQLLETVRNVGYKFTID